MANGKELDGRVAIVTGAARNIGRAIAHDLAAAGAAVVVNARTGEVEAKAVAREIEAGGGRAFAFVADVTDEAAVARVAGAAGGGVGRLDILGKKADEGGVPRVAPAAVERFGRIDILVNNAAVRREQPLAEMTLPAWREILTIILDGAFICAKACLRQLAASGSGAIVNIGGLTAHPRAGPRAPVVSAQARPGGLTRARASA